MFKQNHMNKLQKTYASYKHVKNKTSNFIFIFTVLILVTLGLFTNLPDSADKSWFIAFCLLGAVLFGAWIAVLDKQRKHKGSKK